MARAPLMTLRVDDETKARWQAAAEDAGYSLSEFIRVAVDAHIDDPPSRVRPVFVGSGRPRPAVVIRPFKGGKEFKGPDPKPSGKKKR